MKQIGIILIIGLFGFSGQKLVPTKVTDGVTISLPPELQPMTDEDIVQRYPSVRAPLAAFTNVNRDVDFSVNISATDWPDADLEMAKKFFRASFYHLFDRVDMISEGVQPIRKKNLIFFEFESRVNGNKMKLGEQQPVFRYTYIQYLVEPKRTLVFSFNCPKDQKEEWQHKIHAVMKSLKVK